LLVFFVALSLRFALDLLFFLRLGVYASTSVESWFYVGVMDGSKLPAYGFADPTVWLLRGVGGVIPAGLSYHAVVLTAAALSALTAAALYLLVKELTDQKTGLYAGLLYAGMVEPLALSTAGFTHDHLQLLLTVLLMLFAVKALGTGIRRGLGYALLAGVTVFLGFYVNAGILVGVVVALAHGLHFAANRVFGGRGCLGGRVYAAYMFVALSALAVAAATVIPAALGGILSALPQGRMGSADVVPAGYVDFLLRYNVLLFILPVGAASALKRRDAHGLLLSAFGFVIALSMDRGTRIMDLGVAVLSAYSIVGWRDAFPYGILPLKGRWRLTALWSAASFVVLAYLAEARLEYAFIVLLCGAVLLWRLRVPDDERRQVGSLAAVFAASVLLCLAYIGFASSGSIVSDAEYMMLAWLGGENDGGRVLAPWDRGYMVEVVSGLEAVSSPGSVDLRVHDALWKPERQAAILLRRSGVRYVIVGSDSFAISPDARGGRRYDLRGGLVLPARKAPPTEYGDMLAAYKLAYKAADDRYFRLLRNVRVRGGGEIMVYEVEDDVGGGLDGSSLVGGVAVNLGPGGVYTVNATVTSGSEGHSGLFNESFAAMESREVLYPVGAALGVYNCSLGLAPPGGRVVFPAVFC